MRTLLTILLCALLGGMWVVQPAGAADYPDRPVKLMTMVGPGAQIDLLTRRLANELKDVLGQPLLVKNSPGGSHGSVMAADLSAAKPNGYTLGTSATAAFTYTPHHNNVNYSLDDFTFISMLGLNQSGIVCKPDRPWETLKDAFEWARENDKGLTYMFQGSDDRDVMERIAAQEEVDISLMPSSGGPSVIKAVMGGHADLGHLGAILFEYVQADKLSLLAATTPERLTKIPDVPTLREQGWDESVEMFVVLAAPKGVPEERLEVLEKAMDKLADDEEFRKYIADELKMRPVDFGKEYAEEYMHEAYERFGKQAEQ
ncbi:MAG: tripartite tricarboxylate transporter substrate binding protein [Desulfonatronovibrionaceae bacterium]